MKINIAKFLTLYTRFLDKDGNLDYQEKIAIGEFMDMVNENLNYFTIPQWAYVLATVFHETAHTFLPVKEAFWLSEKWREKNLRYFPWYGRGYVQLTWKANYEKMKKLTGVDIISNPDLAMEPETAFLILIHGMKNGTFTGKKLTDYVNQNGKRYVYARYVINGRDKRDLIAKYAVLFEKILKASI